MVPIKNLVGYQRLRLANQKPLLSLLNAVYSGLGVNFQSAKQIINEVSVY